MSNSLDRKVRRRKEKEEIINIKKVYGKKPKEMCPKCHKKSIFYSNNKKEVFCIRCDKRVA
jgi:hypothetical protein